MHQQILNRLALSGPHIGVDDFWMAGSTALPHNAKPACALTGGMAHLYPATTGQNFGALRARDDSSREIRYVTFRCAACLKNANHTMPPNDRAW